MSPDEYDKYFQWWTCNTLYIFPSTYTSDFSLSLSWLADKWSLLWQIQIWILRCRTDSNVSVHESEFTNEYNVWRVVPIIFWKANMVLSTLLRYVNYLSFDQIPDVRRLFIKWISKVIRLLDICVGSMLRTSNQDNDVFLLDILISSYRIVCMKSVISNFVSYLGNLLLFTTFETKILIKFFFSNDLMIHHRHKLNVILCDTAYELYIRFSWMRVDDIDKWRHDWRNLYCTDETDTFQSESLFHCFTFEQSNEKVALIIEIHIYSSFMWISRLITF